MHRNELLDISANLLNISVDEAKTNNKNLPNSDAIYVWDSRRGGAGVIIEPNGSFLYAISSVNFEDHVKAFSEGKRTDPKLFNI